MPTEQLFFGNDQRSGDHELAGASPLAFNVVIDGQGAIRRRPGISAWSGFPATFEASQIDGMHAFAGDLYYVTSTRRIYRVSGGVVTNLSPGASTTFLDGTTRPAFAETAFRLVIAGGGAPQKVDRAATTSARLGGSPPDATQVIALSQRLFLDDNTSTTTIGRIRNSGVGDAGNETWTATKFVNAEARPDDVVALRENSNEAFAFGETTLQVFTPDPQTVLAPGRAINFGCLAAASVVLADEEFAWLADRDRIVVSAGRGADVVSDPIGKTLGGIGDVSDCWGFRMDVDQFDLLGWAFPSDGRTFVYQKGGGWAQWSGWTDGQGHTPWPATAVYHWPSERLDLVGLATGQIAKVDPEANTDLGARIKAEVTTGFVNHGTDARKTCRVLRLTLRRGVGGDSDPQLLVSWRDDLGGFQNPRRIGLGVSGDHVFHVELHTLGVYRSRQWRIEMSDAADFVLARVQETFDVEDDA